MSDLAAFRVDVVTAIGVDGVLDGDDPAVRERYFVDWTGRYRTTPTLVVRPSSTAQVAALVGAARRHRVPLVPQGGNTGLVGGGVPHRGEVVVSLERMRAVGEVDVAGRQMTAQAGATLSSVQEAAIAAGLRYPVDFGARGSATIGGTVATNAGGINVLRHGMTRQQVVGLEVVLGTGEVVSRLHGLVKDNTGYDLAGLLCGSEGTLGIVTAVRLRLVPARAHRTTVLVGADSVDAVLDVLGRLTAATDDLDAAELMLGSGVDLVGRVSGVECPLGQRSAFLLVEASADSDRDEALLAAIEGVPDTAVVVAAGSSQRDRLWRLRDEHTPCINTLGSPLKFDVTVPTGELSDFVGRIDGVVRGVVPTAEVHVFGHAADGNMHVNVIGVDEDDADVVAEAVLVDVADRRGSVSAEHGIGVAKKKWLHLSRTSTEIAAMRRIKVALDPDAILNPNVLLPDP